MGTVSEADPERGEERIPAWVALGLWTTGALALCRLAGLLSSMYRGVGVATQPEARLFDWSASHAFFDLLTDALVIGMVAAALAARSVEWRESRPRRRLGVVLFVFGLLACGFTGWPLGRAAYRAQWYAEWAFDDFGVGLLLAFLTTAGLVQFMLWVGGRPRLARVLATPWVVATSLFLAVLFPGYVAWNRSSAAPTYQIAPVVLDFLATPSARNVLEQSDLGAPVAGVITPAVSQHTDSADKPALIMPPPSRVELRVPELDGRLLLSAAAGVDKSVRNRMPDGVERIVIEYTARVNGAEVFREQITNERPTPGAWDPSRWVWRHVGGEQGLQVEAGDRVELATRLVEPDASLLDAQALRVGFGGLTLRREFEMTRRRATPEAPNIVLVVMDTLRADRMSCYGYPKLTTPNLDRFASQGVLYEQAFTTSSWTWPSTASILTGLPADAHGVTSNESCTMNLAQTSLAEVLQLRGYKTHAVSCNPLIAPQRYFDQGFETFDYSVPEFRMSDEVMPDVLRWLRANAGSRFFLYLHLADPHTPHRPHPAELARLGGERPANFPERGVDAVAVEWLERPDRELPPDFAQWISDEYNASVATGDRWLGEFLDELDALDLTGQTIVAFTADHGEELLDHGGLGHGHTLQRELVHTPLILRGPSLPRGERRAGVVSNRHLAPTLARLGGAQLEGMNDGLFLLRETAGSAFFQTTKGRWGALKRQALFGLRTPDWVLHWRDAPGTPDVRLYRGTDRAQLENVAPQHPAVVTELLVELKARLAAQREFAPEHTVGVGAAGLETLYAIGYAERVDEDERESSED